jgi:hypothetical protein
MSPRILVLIPALCAAAFAGGPVSLDEGYRQMYNLEFVEAHETMQRWIALHPDDAMGPASDAAAYLFSEFRRLHILESEFFVHDRHFITDNSLTPDPDVKRAFDAALEKAHALAARRPEEENAMLASILANGLRSNYLALVEKRYVASFKEMKAGRKVAERLLARDPNLYDAWLAIGVENYLLSIKPAPVRWLLQLAGAETDRELGLEKLRLTAEKGRYLAPFARLLLAVAALRDQDTAHARALLAGLIREFPRNPLYAKELARLGDPNGGSGISFRAAPE